jgi:ABC-type antimicrobial peptide transport system permease subunit
MYLRLSLTNLKAKPLRTALTTSAVLISVTFLTFFNSFQNGLKNYLLKNSLEENPLTQLTVKPAGNGGFGLNPVNLLSKQKLTTETIAEIQKIPHVQSVEPQSTIKGISSLQVNLFGQSFQTDSLLFGAPYQTVASSDLKAEQWQVPAVFDQNHPIPALVSSRLIDLYNYSFASANGLPQLSAQNFIGTEVDILLNQSTFFGGIAPANAPRLRAKVVGFSPKVKLIGLTIPDQAIDRLNQQYLNEEGKNYPDALVKVDSVSNLDNVKKALQNINLQASSGQDELETINHYFTIFGLALNLISLIVLAVCGLMIASTFLTKVAERTKDIGIMRAIGASAHQIEMLFLTEAALIGLASGIVGYLISLVLAVISNQILQQLLQNLQNKPQNFFEYQPLQFLEILLFTIFFCLLFAYLPAKQAAKLDPLTALSK